jgi:hypothetical protein
LCVALLFIFTDVAPVYTSSRLCPQLLDGKTVGAGHWAMLEVPEQVDAMIGRFLEIAGYDVRPTRLESSGIPGRSSVFAGRPGGRSAAVDHLRSSTVNERVAHR